MFVLSLNGIWQLEAAGEAGSVPARVPGSVLDAFLAAGRLEDPYRRRNETAARDFCERDFLYSTAFDADPDLLGRKRIELVCLGLDTVATLEVNGQVVGRTANMHRSFRFDIARVLRLGKNTIRIRLASPLREIRERLAASPDAISYVAGGNLPGTSLLRKAHCMYGWDWGPQLPDAGIWRDIRIEAFDTARLDEVAVSQDHREDGTVRLAVRLRADAADPGSILRAWCTLTAPDGQVLRQSLDLAGGRGETVFAIRNPQRWWPNGYGDQPLYRLQADLLDGTGPRPCDSRTLRLGLRTLTVSRDRDEWGESFALTVNGVRIFAMGANYIPEDALFPRIRPERTRRLLEDCVAAHFNCLRVWGGGYYPDDFFYDLCDELGLLVWQDLMYACNVYSLERGFAEEAEAEARENIRRIRHHACLGLWCGNNELEWGWVEWPDMASHSMKLRADYVRLFEQILPNAVREEDPQTFYWPSSPSSGGCFDAPNDGSRGDTHYWEVWHLLKPITAYRDHFFRFCSEFGFQSFPCLRTVESFTIPGDRNIFSQVMESHQKNGAANGRILAYLADTYLYPKDFDSLLYVSQLLQAEAIRCGVEHWRRHRGRCMGALYWQLNDNWPVASWSGIDHAHRWKALHHAARRFFAPRMATAAEDGLRASLFIHNETLAPFEGVLSVRLLTTDLEVLEARQVAVRVPALSVHPALDLDVSEPAARVGAERLVAAFDLAIDGHVESCGTTLFVAPKHLALTQVEYDVSVEEQADAYAITVRAPVYCRAVELWFDDMDPVLSDNFFDLVSPGGRTVWLDKRQLPEPLSADDLAGRLRIRSLADSYEA